MSNVIDELKIIFSADSSALTAGLMQISGELAGMQGVSDAAAGAVQTGLGLINGELLNMQGLAGAAAGALGTLAEVFAGSLAGASGEAYSAGAEAGTAFANGLRAKAGSVSAAAKYLSETAVRSLGGSYSVGAAAESGGVETSGFSESTMSGNEGTAVGAGLRQTEITVPLNVDGVKLGEACIKAIERVASVTGRAHLAL